VTSLKTDGGFGGDETAIEFDLEVVAAVKDMAMGIHLRLFGLLVISGSKSRLRFKLRVAQAIDFEIGNQLRMNNQ